MIKSDFFFFYMFVFSYFRDIFLVTLVRGSIFIYIFVIFNQVYIINLEKSLSFLDDTLVIVIFPSVYKVYNYDQIMRG
jgi:hypothetical protein